MWTVSEMEASASVRCPITFSTADCNQDLARPEEMRRGLASARRTAVQETDSVIEASASVGSPSQKYYLPGYGARWQGVWRKTRGLPRECTIIANSLGD